MGDRYGHLHQLPTFLRKEEADVVTLAEKKHKGNKSVGEEVGL